MQFSWAQKTVQMKACPVSRVGLGPLEPPRTVIWDVQGWMRPGVEVVELSASLLKKELRRLPACSAKPKLP